MTDMNYRDRPKLLSADVLVEFALEATLGFLPALLLLPVFIIAFSIESGLRSHSIVRGGGARLDLKFLQPSTLLRGKVLAGFGPTVAFVALPTIAYCVSEHPKNWSATVFLCSVALVFGGHAVYRSLRSIAERQAGR